MAPEQALDSRHADQLSDIYSLGGTLYFLLTGEPLYRGSTLDEQIAAHRNSPLPTLTESRPDIPAAVDAVFRKMVAKQPCDRYQSVDEVERNLNDCLSSFVHTTSSHTDHIPEFVLKAIFDE